MLENIYQMVCESKMMYGIEVCRLSEAWIQLDKVHSRFCRKLMGTPNCAANAFAEMEFGSERRTGKCIGRIVIYWYRIMCLDIEYPVK
jgi:hypothetical protein